MYGSDLEKALKMAGREAHFLGMIHGHINYILEKSPLETIREDLMNVLHLIAERAQENYYTKGE